MFVTIITCIGLVCSALSAAFAIRSARQNEQRIPKTAFVWGAVFMLLQAFIAVWSGIGLVQDDPISAAAFTLVTTACAAASTARSSAAIGRRISPPPTAARGSIFWRKGTSPASATNTSSCKTASSPNTQATDL